MGAVSLVPYGQAVDISSITNVNSMVTGQEYNELLTGLHK